MLSRLGWLIKPRHVIIGQGLKWKRESSIFGLFCAFQPSSIGFRKGSTSTVLLFSPLHARSTKCGRTTSVTITPWDEGGGLVFDDTIQSESSGSVGYCKNYAKTFISQTHSISAPDILNRLTDVFACLDSVTLKLLIIRLSLVTYSSLLGRSSQD